MNLIKKIENNTWETKNKIINIFLDSFMYLNQILSNFTINKYILYWNNLTINAGVINYTAENNLNKIWDELLIYKSDTEFEYTTITAIDWNVITFTVSNDYTWAILIGSTYDYNFTTWIENYIYCESNKSKEFQSAWKDITWKVLDRSYSEKTVPNKSSTNYCNVSKTSFSQLTDYIKISTNSSELGWISYLIN